MLGNLGVIFGIHCRETRERARGKKEKREKKRGKDLNLE